MSLIARCCGTAGCGCKVVGGTGVTISGSGTSSDPFVINADLHLAVSDTTTINLSLLGSGTMADPWVLEANLTARLDDLTDVNTAGQSAGQVLGFDGTVWKPVAATTAPTGAVTHDTAFVGDGSGGSPLGINEDPNRLLATSATGLGLSDLGMNSVVRHYADAAARTAGTPAPVLNSLTMLNSAPGRIDYWTGTAWAPVSGAIGVAAGSTAFMAMSGAWTNQPVKAFFKQISGVSTDSAGSVSILSVADLAGYAGVMSVTVTPVGANAWVPVLAPLGTSVSAFIYLLSSGAIYPNAQISATVTAYLY